MATSIDKRVKKLEDLLNSNRSKRIVASVLYNPNIFSQSDLPHIEADVVLYLPDNGFRVPQERVMPEEGYLINYF